MVKMAVLQLAVSPIFIIWRRTLATTADKFLMSLGARQEGPTPLYVVFSPNAPKPAKGEESSVVQAALHCTICTARLGLLQPCSCHSHKTCRKAQWP